MLQLQRVSSSVRNSDALQGSCDVSPLMRGIIGPNLLPAPRQNLKWSPRTKTRIDGVTFVN